jgi:dTMP kinase
VNGGWLIAFEGIDGAGKSTQLPLLAERLRATGRRVVETHEPTEGSWGQRIRAMARSGERVEPEREVAWFVADRREHVAQVIEPALQRGDVVLTDRYFLSTVAYQGARGLDPRALLEAAEAEFPLPDLALLFEIDAEVGRARIAARAASYEPGFEDLAVLREAARVFRGLERDYLVRLDATLSPGRLQRLVWNTVCGRLPELAS